MTSHNRIVVAHASDLSIPDGATQRVIAFINALTESGYEVYLITSKPSSGIPKNLKRVKIYIAPIRATGSIYNQALRGLMIVHMAKTLAERKKAMVQIEHSTLGGLASRIGLKNFILDVHDLIYTSPIYKQLPRVVQREIYALERNAVRNASTIITVSKIMKEFLVKYWYVDERKIRTIPNGFWWEKIQGIGKKTTKNYEGNIIVRVGHLFEFLDVNAIIKLAKALPKDVRIFLIGDGVFRRYLEHKLREENLKNVIITGFLEYEEAMKIVLRSKIAFDCVKRNLTTMLACPVKIFDYAALGKAMVLSDVSEISRELKKKGCALVSTPENIDEFLNNVQKSLINTELRKQLGMRALEFAKEYRWEKLGEKLIKIYEELA